MKKLMAAGALALLMAALDAITQNSRTAARHL